MKTPRDILLQVANYGGGVSVTAGDKWTHADEKGETCWLQEHWEPMVAEQLDALDAAGYVIVPKEPTKEMIDKAEDALEDHKDSDWDSGSDGESHNSYTYYTSGAARDMYVAALAVAPNAKKPPTR